MVIVVVAERPFILNEEAGGAVAHSLVHLGHREGDPAYLTLREKSGRTFMRDELPAYCAHCSVNNEMQPVEWGGAPTTIEHPPERKGEPCVHHVYKDVDAIPDAAYVRIGMPNKGERRP